MKTSIKTIQDVSGLHDLRSYTGAVRKSGKPALPTTAILDLHMRRNEKERIEKELKVLKRRKGQLQRRLGEVGKEMTKLFEKATQTAAEMGGISVKGKRNNPVGRSGKKGKTVLNY